MAAGFLGVDLQRAAEQAHQVASMPQGQAQQGGRDVTGTQLDSVGGRVEGAERFASAGARALRGGEKRTVPGCVSYPNTVSPSRHDTCTVDSSENDACRVPSWQMSRWHRHPSPMYRSGRAVH
ncbi:hypothetical protein PV343_02965 [Streptomyces sp. WI03-4A]|uniref:hypothetical protein n=1 Tax=Streptomyces sp. WI03-4A TaxID=3028706 RepID=UPI0029A3A42B|nr:hypothetical protein [Streptomyces sp. WI03-4A]MDX2591283.1 hypothetical protein [Streptomyces sp. WI03-4A]